MEFSTPMMKQYYEIKKQYPDCLLFFRMGDFYELFLEDAHLGARVLDITLTGKAGGKDGRIPMAGVPFHAVDSYLTKLVKAGYKVAICEQMTEPDGKGLVEREVVRIVTPGTVLDEKALEKKENNYVISITTDDTHVGIATADVSTGQFMTAEFPIQDMEQVISDELARINPTECILPKRLYDDARLLKLLRVQKNLNIFPFHDWNLLTTKPESHIKKHFGIHDLASFGMKDKKSAIEASAALLGYLKYTQKDKISHFKHISTWENSDHMILDRSSLVNLELFTTIREHDRRGSLINLLDDTITGMGGRLLRTWIRKPLVVKRDIDNRLDAVELFVNNREARNNLRENLKNVADIERVLSRLSVGIGNARDLVTIKTSLQVIMEIKEFLKSMSPKLISKIQSEIDIQLNKVIELLESHILETPKFDIKGGGMIKLGVDKDLDILHEHAGGGRTWVEELEKTERERTGISTLKVRFNKVFGFYIEVSKGNVDRVPKDYFRKQTLVNGERFITPELKEKEELILTAEEKICDLEYKIFTEVLHKVLDETEIIQKSAQAIACLDCLLNFAHLAEKQDYCKPVMKNDGETIIKAGRHPVVETLLEDQQFVPNDVTLNEKDHQLLILTGPNMAGKSVFSRQVALIVLLAQTGSFIPARSAEISIVDRIFVRSGASDVITSGLSTFMVEMVETAHILNHATSNSLIVMDEIGRGTSTYDGISIAWAIAEYLVSHKKIKPKTIFATHYHELQELENDHPDKIKNYQMAIEEQKGRPIFLHTLIRGGASHSHGVAVAKLAGIPEEVIKKSLQMLEKLEERKLDHTEKKHVTNRLHNKKESSDTLLEELKKIDVHNLTPLEALNKLAELKKNI